jgi:uncharacterized protein
MFGKVDGFDWDEGNIAKCQKHGVSIDEIEALFENEDFRIFNDDLHSYDEQRFRVIGRNPSGRHIFLGFTLRQNENRNLLRVFMARYMHKKEIENYAQKIPYPEN